ncbi:twin-arginine translocation signal domain-containing protein [Candidatus Phyllobacterium onerii]|uniref:twin-arginine translocation signal domain-containing protein n=1 Tax=Candidatus Phyllobacterium onerii TaxID=3020828 RepID=UPI00232F0452|nr:twin-arginine translocation signal domain-containing protein [Phyllobacterium sp. IY22]
MKKQSSFLIRRRDLLSLATVGTAAVAMGTALSESAVAFPSDAGGKRRPRYQANSDEVKNFYRVNRYPSK